MEYILIKNFKTRLNDLQYYTDVTEDKYNPIFVDGDNAILTKLDYINFCIDELNNLK